MKGHIDWKLIKKLKEARTSNFKSKQHMLKIVTKIDNIPLTIIATFYYGGKIIQYAQCLLGFYYFHDVLNVLYISLKFSDAKLINVKVLG